MSARRGTWEILDLATELECPNPFHKRYSQLLGRVRGGFSPLLGASANIFVHGMTLGHPVAETRGGHKVPLMLTEFAATLSTIALDGTNLLLFDTSLARIGASLRVEIVEAKVEYQPARKRVKRE